MKLSECTPEVRKYVLSDRQWMRDQRIGHAELMKKQNPKDSSFWNQVIAVNKS